MTLIESSPKKTFDTFNEALKGVADRVASWFVNSRIKGSHIQVIVTQEVSQIVVSDGRYIRSGTPTDRLGSATTVFPSPCNQSAFQTTLKSLLDTALSDKIDDLSEYVILDGQGNSSSTFKVIQLDSNLNNYDSLGNILKSLKFKFNVI